MIVIKDSKNKLRWPGVEPGSIAWKATMLTVTPPTPADSQPAELTFCVASTTIVLTITQSLRKHYSDCGESGLDFC